MPISPLKRVSLTLAVAFASVTSAHAQDRIPADPDPTRLANAPNNANPQSDWQVQVGGGLIYGPAFLGSKDHQLQGGPSIEVRYKDRVFLSVIDGAGVDIIKTDHLRAGPIVKFQQKRRESGTSTFVIAGGASDALRGLGDVSATAEVGGYVQYQVGGFSAKVEVRKGTGGHKGIIADLGARYTTGLMGMTVGERPVIVSVGPRASIVDRKYNQAYFGVDAAQSAASSLAQFNAKGGLLSFGAGTAVVVPLSGKLSAAILGGFDRVSGDAGRSPLVRERGSRNQGTIGLGLSYRFGV
jgi:outer membrane protein